jgi:RNA polymerase sigma factor (sigma-70 family)
VATESPNDAVLTPYSKNLISYLSRQIKPKRAFRRDSQQDLEQDLTTYLLSRAHLFDPSRGSANTFADRAIRSGIAMMLRDRLRQKRAPEIDNASLEQPEPASEEGSPSMRDALTDADLRRRTGAADDRERAERIEAVREVLQSLPPEDQKLCLLRMSGSDASVARGLGMTVRQVREAFERIRKRFEAAGLGDS